MSDQKLKVEIAPPEAGWTAVTLSAGERSYGFFPSHVPYDSVRDLVNAVLKILDGYPEAIVRWNDEPVEHEFVFTSTNGQLCFRAYEITESVVVGRVRDEKVAFSGTLYEVLGPFWKGLRGMQSKQSLAEYEQRWREPFPEREMSELTRRIKEIKLNSSGAGAV